MPFIDDVVFINLRANVLSNLSKLSLAFVISSYIVEREQSISIACLEPNKA